MKLQNYRAGILRESIDASHVCALLPRVGLKEVNITKQGLKQP